MSFEEILNGLDQVGQSRLKLVASPLVVVCLQVGQEDAQYAMPTWVVVETVHEAITAAMSLISERQPLLTSREKVEIERLLCGTGQYIYGDITVPGADWFTVMILKPYGFGDAL